MLILESLILERLPINRLSTGSIPCGNIPCLHHKPRFYPVKMTAFVVERLPTQWAHSFFTCAKTLEVFSCLGDVLVQLELDCSDLVVVDFDVHPDLLVLIELFAGVALGEALEL